MFCVKNVIANCSETVAMCVCVKHVIVGCCESPQLQDNEFLFISILLYDIFALFSIYKILKNSRCSAVHFFWFTHV